MMDPAYDNPPWRAGANPFSGHGYYNPFQGWFGWGSSPSTSTTLDYGGSSNSTGTKTMPDPGPPGALARRSQWGRGGKQWAGRLTRLRHQPAAVVG